VDELEDEDEQEEQEDEFNGMYFKLHSSQLLSNISLVFIDDRNDALPDGIRRWSDYSRGPHLLDDPVEEARVLEEIAASLRCRTQTVRRVGGDGTGLGRGEILSNKIVLEPLPTDKEIWRVPCWVSLVARANRFQSIEMGL
jgi:hypothetical protein